MCGHLLLFAFLKPPLFGCLGGLHYWFPVFQFSKLKPNWAAYGSLLSLSPSVSLCLSLPNCLSHLSFVFLIFIFELSSLSFLLFLTHWCDVLLYFCHWYARSVFKTQRLKKVESSLDWSNSSDSCSRTSRKTYCSFCFSGFKIPHWLFCMQNTPFINFLTSYEKNI